ncbi:MAG TPA: hypothetical protein EYH20_00645 [Leucothrix sp.]|nr:hypothetical protein [Leucothrix sp.]
MNIKWVFSATILSILLTACGGDGGGGEKTDTTPPDSPATPSFQRLTGGRITVSGTAEAGSTVRINFSEDGSSISKRVAANGTYSVTSPNPIITRTSSEVSLTATDAAGNTSQSTFATIAAPAIITVPLTARFKPTVPIIGANYRTSLYNDTGRTLNNGNFSYTEGETVIFDIAGKSYNLLPRATNTIQQLLPVTATSDTEQNLKLILLNLDNDANPLNGINLTGVTASIDPTLSTNEVNKRLYIYTGLAPRLLFSPSLGVNTEAPQGESDLVGQPMPFVDIFRTARPFSELSGQVKLDGNGWPFELDSSLNFARTKLLQGTLDKAIPNGKYTLFYDGSGTVQIGGSIISNIRGLSTQQGYSFDLNLKNEPNNPEANAIGITIKNISPGNYVKNIRIIMPGGTCENTNSGERITFIRADSSADCPSNAIYTSFAEEFSTTRNRITFNPDYLAFLRQFKVVRMMNLTESSHGRSSCMDGGGIIDKTCVTEPMRWDDRAKMHDAVWGGSARTRHTKRNGVPVEVVVALANTLNRDMWVNMPHAATDEYIFKFAEHAFQNLKNNLKTYIEYSNETWNPGFVGHFYVEQRGIELGLNTVPPEFRGYRDEEYFARLRFYSRRSSEIFSIWKTAFGGSNSRLIRVLGTNQGDKVLSEQMIKFVGAGAIDAIAMAPYFFGCVEKTGSCRDAPKVLKDATTVDDIFDIINQDKQLDPSALSGAIAKIDAQAGITSKYNLQLLTYEGGQHLTTSVMGRLQLSEPEKDRFRALFKQVNRDPRMKQLYEDLLIAWMERAPNSTTLFTLYTLPQTFYRFGNWGLKEHLNASRANSPKFDGVMTFQEGMGECWWNNCQ